MISIAVPNLGHWAVTTIQCGCGKVTTHVYLIGTLDSLDCDCGGPAYTLGWEVMEEPEDAPSDN